MTDKIVTEAMIEAGYAIMCQTPSEAGCDYKTQLGRAYTAMSTAQEPALDDDALLRIRRFRHDLGLSMDRGGSPLGFAIRAEEQRELVAALDSAINRLETGE